jgi:hypothetical protein
MPGEISEVRLEIQGLAELSRALKQVDSEIPIKLRPGFMKVAKAIAADIQSKLPGSLKKAIGTRATQKGAGITFPGGEARGPLDFYPWYDFGGSTGRHHRVGVPFSGAVTREWWHEGRYVYPTIQEDRPQIEEMVDDVIQDACKRAELATEGSLI